MSTAKSANVGFRLAVQLFAPPTNPSTHLVQKIPFINPQKKIFLVSTMCAQRLGFSRVNAKLYEC